MPETEERPTKEERTATSKMREALDKLIADRGLKSGNGPPMAYFERVPDPDGTVRRYVYISFGARGPQEQGVESLGVATLEELQTSTLEAFGKWLQPDRAVVWRHRADVKKQRGLWSVFFRCVQIDDNSNSMPITWNF